VLPERSHALTKAPEMKLIAERQIGSNGSIPDSGIACLQRVIASKSPTPSNFTPSTFFLLNYSNPRSQM
jgi:hypothetical protein